MTWKFIFFMFLATMTTGCLFAQKQATLPLVPWPQNVEPGSGTFTINASTTISISDPGNEELQRVVNQWADRVRKTSGFSLPVKKNAEAGNAIVFSLTRTGGANNEAYTLDVTPTRVKISAGTTAGVFYATQTLRQLLPAAVDGSTRITGAASWSLPVVHIEDAPRFPYRGMHLDVSRHFFPVTFVKRYIDLLATYKMNTFHWHLTDDQGWRIEIKKYPRLTQVGSTRKETMVGKNFPPSPGDKTPYGGFYTQEEIREVVAYARDRYITVVPEIEMPGHAMTAITAYPNLACTEGPFEVGTYWGVYEDIFCPKEETFRFVEDVLTEVMALFPGKYIHVGGDEAPKARWKESPIAREVIKREGLKDEHELQSYFIQRVERFLNAHGRSLIGWDEILEGGLAPQATVMSWRGTAGGIAAARQRHDVIMTPTDAMYFDYYQGDPQTEPLANGGVISLQDVYAYEPVPDELTAEEAVHILGAQANVWSEYIKTTDHVEYMVFPRLLALSEIDWSPRETHNWDSFVQRLKGNLPHLDMLKVNYRKPEL